jgi:hypothetical protein
MGLKAYAAIRAWIEATMPSAVLREPPVPVDRALSCTRIDLTQKLRQSPPDLTGDEFCTWLWRFVSALPTKYVVALMDKPSFVPPQKHKLQRRRDAGDEEPSLFTADSVFGPLGVLHPGAEEPVRFSGSEALRCRPARGALVDWVRRWCIDNRATHHSEQFLLLEYEHPVGVPCAWQLGPEAETTGDVGHLAVPMGEADMVQLEWLDRFYGHDCIDLQIDSDLLPIALLHLLRTPPDDRPQSWVWVASNSADWQGAFCVDLLELHRRLGDAAVMPAVLSFVLGDTDYYTSHRHISPFVDFATLHAAVLATWAECWAPIVPSLLPDDRALHALVKLVDAQRIITRDSGRRKPASITRVLRGPLPTDAELRVALDDLRFCLNYWNASQHDAHLPA